MKILNYRYALVSAALAGITLVPIADAQGTSSSSSSSPPAFAGRHFHGPRGPGGMFVRTLLRATRQLNLSSEQKQEIKGLISQARSQARSSTTTAPDITVLGNPGDPNFATAVQSMQSGASARVQQESELASSIYALLTTEQKTQLPTVLASLKAQAAQRRAAWQARHSSGTTSSN
jgi:Spy/CpxP family protein refolding chaperone